MKTVSFSVGVLDEYPQWNEHHAGGNSLNQAVHFASLGAEASFAGAFGMDEPGQRLKRLLETAKVNVSLLHFLPGATPGNTLTVDASGERFGVEGAWKGGVYETFRFSEEDWDALSGFDVWSTHASNPEFRTALKRKTAKQLLSVDFMHFTDMTLLEECLPCVDISFFGGTPDMAEAIHSIARRSKALVVLTLGSRGSIAFLGDRILRQDALPLERVVDTTGCGDAFQAGFTHEWMRSGDPEAALHAGALRGARAASWRGGIPWDIPVMGS